MTTYEDVRALPHLADVRELTSNGAVLAWRITMEEGYVIHLPAFGENQWKTATLIYPRDDLSTIVICAESDLDEDAVVNGDTTPPVEVMAEGESAPVTE